MIFLTFAKLFLTLLFLFSVMSLIVVFLQRTGWRMSRCSALLRYTAETRRILNLCCFLLAWFFIKALCSLSLSYALFLLISYLPPSFCAVDSCLLAVIKKIVAGMRWSVLCLLFSSSSVVSFRTVVFSHTLTVVHSCV